MSYKKKANNTKKPAATAKGGKTPIDNLLNSAEILESMKRPASSSGIRLPIPQAGLSKQYNVTRTASATTGTKIKQNTASSSNYAPPAKRQRVTTNLPTTNIQGNMQNAPVRGTYSQVTRQTNTSLPGVSQKTSFPQHANTSTKVALPAPNNSSQIPQKSNAVPTRKNPSRSASLSPVTKPNSQMVPVPQKFKPKENKEDKISKANAIVKDDITVPSTSPSDIYDAMIGEISDLLQAAQEAQAFGRMKMSATYQLLAHTRLVGLGKRFDGFLVHNNNGLEPSTISGSMTPLPVSPTTTPASSKMQSKQPRVLKFPDDASNQPHPSSNSKTASSRKPNAKDIQDAQESLAKILPTGVDLDDSMMEHLARAAMELHNKRTGKGLLHERQENKQPTPKPPITKHAITNLNNIVASTHMEQPGGVAWTEVEKRKFFEGVHIFGDTNANAIAAHIGTRTSTEVKSHLRNMSARTRIEIQITTPIEEQITKKEAEKNLEQKPEGDNEDQTSSTTKLRRGKKAGSRAMLTVANPVFDAKKMVQGKI